MVGAGHHNELLGLGRGLVDGLADGQGLRLGAGDDQDGARADLLDVVQRLELHHGQLAGGGEAAAGTGVMAARQTVEGEELARHRVHKLVGNLGSDPPRPHGDFL